MIAEQLAMACQKNSNLDSLVHNWLRNQANNLEEIWKAYQKVASQVEKVDLANRQIVEHFVGSNLEGQNDWRLNEAVIFLVLHKENFPIDAWDKPAKIFPSLRYFFFQCRDLEWVLRESIRMREFIKKELPFFAQLLLEAKEIAGRLNELIERLENFGHRRRLLNFSNHPSDGWSDKQKEGWEIFDLPFPEIEPGITTSKLALIVNEWFEKIKAHCENHSIDAIYFAGEYTFSYILLLKLLPFLIEKSITIAIPTTKRIAVENNDGTKISIFEFVNWREISPALFVLQNKEAK